LLQRCRLRGQARRSPRQRPPFDGHQHEPRQAVPGIRTLGAFGTRRPFPSRAYTQHVAACTRLCRYRKVRPSSTISSRAGLSPRPAP
jgi:hypothetical protein